MRIALMLDTSDAAAPALMQMRAGALAFLDAIPPEAEVILVTTGRQMRVRVPPSIDRKKLKATAAGLFTDGGGTVLMDGLLELDDRFFKKVDDRWPVFVIITSDGTESSSGAREKDFTRWSPLLRLRGVAVHALVYKTPNGRGSTADMIAENITHNAGGLYEAINTTTALAQKMSSLGEKLALDQHPMSTWYEVDIQTDASDATPIDLAVNREGVKVQLSGTRPGR
jgi:hypothetical protein